MIRNWKNVVGASLPLASVLAACAVPPGSEGAQRPSGPAGQPGSSSGAASNLPFMEFISPPEGYTRDENHPVVGGYNWKAFFAGTSLSLNDQQLTELAGDYQARS